MSNATADQTRLPNSPKPKQKIKPTARVRKRLQDAPPVTLTVTNFAHDGRGVASYGDQPDHHLDKHGKKYSSALRCPTRPWASKSQAHVKVWRRWRAWSVGKPKPSTHHPTLPAFQGCGGCSLQHWQPMGRFNLSNRYWQSCSNTKPISSLKTGFPIGCWPFGLPHQGTYGRALCWEKGTALVGFSWARWQFFGKFKWMPCLTCVSVLKLRT